MNIFITGATGFLGSSLVKKLVEENHHIYVLVRNRKRLEALLEKFDADNRKQIHVIEGDLSKEYLGIQAAVLQTLIGKIDTVYHTAAFLSFDELKREEIFEMNVQGTQYVLDLAEVLNVKKFIHVSTAYTLGARTRGEESLYPLDSTFINSYEESKCHAEHLVMSYKDVFDVTIMRPAIIIGDSQTGEADTSFGLYGILRTVELLKKRVQKGKAKGTETYRLLAEKDTVSNFVPVNYVTKVLVLGLMNGRKNTIYNITNSVPPTNEKVFQAIKAGLNAEMVEIVPYAEKESLSEYEKVLNQPLEVFSEYLNRSIVFDAENTKELLKNANETTLTMDKEMLLRIVKGFRDRRLHKKKLAVTVN
ncbi:SDR family NAD(P)-dependent oxidoreductase [Bacillus sp. 165]|uniref:SDR family NAD(P)-dependent oxidoreductase n=1 Tax=Bacillus sp. 165 TaxID=1529117 RepID=UPI001ADCD3BA|nr:SDR family NAD(P)-dependent oxidoreductase [Bacillus sp. 165]MBO9128395.1 SDR family NAD(P)-dependent oxidoreductase [Bacillus sp. 165]